MTATHQEAENHFLKGLQIIGDPPYLLPLDAVNLPLARDKFKAAVDANPEYGLAHVYLGITRLLLKDKNEAVSSFHSALELMPQCSLAYTYQAWTRGDDTSAMGDFKNAARTAPNHWLPYFEKGRYHQARNHNQSAIDAYTKAIANSAPSVAHFQRGICYMRERKYPAAIDDFTATVALDPECHEAHAHRAECWVIMGNDHAAIADYDVAIDHLPGRLAPHHRYRGYAKLRSEDLEAAIADFELAIEMENGTQAESYHFLSMAHFKTGDVSEALSDINKAMAITPNNPVLYQFRARIREVMNDGQQSPGDHDRRMADIINAAAADKES